jgi:tetratricopeptide (TPR) repeat protein
LKQEPATDALRLVGATGWFWDVRGQREGMRRSLQVVSAPAAQERSLVRAKALNAAGHLQWVGGRALLQEALALGRELQSDASVSLSLQFLGIAATFEGDYEAARLYFEEGLALARTAAAGDTYFAAEALIFQGDGAFLRGDYERARRLYTESATPLRELGDRFFLAYPVRQLGHLALRRGDLDEAAALGKESLRLNREIVDGRGMAASLAGLAGVALAHGQAARAARLLGAEEAQFRVLGIALFKTDQAEFDLHLAAARAQLGEATFTEAWAEGQAMTLDQAAAYALAETD